MKSCGPVQVKGVRGKFGLSQWGEIRAAMRETWDNAVCGRTVLLLPYRAEYVPRYHEWMEDPWLREMTAVR